MKSIKEKANEYAKDYLFSSLQRAPNVHFEEGANYVLETIKDIISNPRRYVSADMTVPEGMINNIVERINQLENNQ